MSLLFNESLQKLADDWIFDHGGFFRASKLVIKLLNKYAPKKNEIEDTAKHLKIKVYLLKAIIFNLKLYRKWTSSALQSK